MLWDLLVGLRLDMVKEEVWDAGGTVRYYVNVDPLVSNENVRGVWIVGIECY